MTIAHRKIRDLDRVDIFLNGGVFGGKDFRLGLYGLHGKTLKLVSPGAGTVTFVASPGNDQGYLTLAQIIDQINAGVGGFASITARSLRGELAMIEDSPSSGVIVDKTGTANPLLGFSSVVDTTGIVYGAPGSGAPQYLQTVIVPMDGTYLITTDE